MDWGEIERRTAEVNTAFEGKGLTLGYLKDGKIQGGLCVFTYLSIQYKVTDDYKVGYYKVELCLVHVIWTEN